jgi:hypothetical protein
MIKQKSLLLGLAAVFMLLLLGGGAYGYMYYSSPAHIRYPEFEHYHFRTQIAISGKLVDFSQEKFQNETPGACSTDPGGTPIDFHDNIDQMTHVHWKGMTGGEFLKGYGWNFIGGSDGSLGRRYDDGFMSAQSVQRYGDLLPGIPEGLNFYVYTGDQNSYKQMSWDDFLHKDLEDFFGQKSNLNQDEQASLLERLFFPKAYAHGNLVIDNHDNDAEKTEEELARINNLIGNVVIFVQKDVPTKEQVQARFSNLVPLQDSICGG